MSFKRVKKKSRMLALNPCSDTAVNKTQLWMSAAILQSRKVSFEFLLGGEVNVCVTTCIYIIPLPSPPLPCPDRLSEGMRELEVLVDKRDTLVAAPLLLIHTHKKCQTVGGSYSVVSDSRWVILGGVRQ